MTPRPLHIGDDANGQPHYLTPLDRTMGLHVLGTVGVGKSQGLNYMIEQDERDLPGALVTVDVAGNHEHSMYAQALARAIHYQPRRPTYFINLSAPRWVYGFNIFARREGADLSTRVQQCIRRIFTAWNMPDLYERPRILFWGTGVFTAGMHRGDVGLTEMRLLLDHEQAALRTHLTADTPVAARWRTLNEKRLADFEESIEGIRNRLDPFVSAATPRRFLSLIHPPAMLDFRTVFTQRARVHINAQESDQLDREHANLICTLLGAAFIEEACQRPDAARAPVALYLDEAHRFVSTDLAAAFVEGRKFNIFTTIAHQHLGQLRQKQDERILNDILSCARTKMVFALGSDKDAKELVHEVFVGEHGINYTEVKHVQPQTKFRPVATREQSITTSQGGGTAKSRGTRRGTTTDESTTIGQSRTHSEGRDTGESDAEGESTAATRSVAATHTAGRTTTQSVADGVAVTETASGSRTTGDAETEAQTQNRGTAQGTAYAKTTQKSPTGVVTHIETSSTTDTVTANDLEGRSTVKTKSEALTEGESKSVTQSRVNTLAQGESESEAETWTQAQGETATRTRTTSRNRNEADAETLSTSTTTRRGQSESEDESKTQSKNWAQAITDGPGTRHEEFREDAPTFYTLEEQRQRKADELRLSPQRGFVLRLADCRTARLTVPLRPPLRYSTRVMLAHEARSAAKTGAVSCEEADRLIARRLEHIETQAREFAAPAKRAVHFGDDVGDEPPSPTRLKRRTSKKSAAEGQGRAQGPPRAAGATARERRSDPA